MISNKNFFGKITGVNCYIHMKYSEQNDWIQNVLYSTSFNQVFSTEINEGSDEPHHNPKN